MSRTERTFAVVGLLFLLLMLSTSMVRAQGPEVCAVDDDCVVELRWDAPTEREGGEALSPSEIAGYRIYQAVDRDIDADGEYVAVSEGTERDVTLDLVPRNEPYIVRFAATAVDTDGRESALSNIVEVSLLVPVMAPGPPVLRVTIRRGTQ